MGFTVGNQLLMFFLSVAFSALVGFEYDLFRFSRLIFHPGVWAVFAEDLIFFILCSVEFFLFCFIFNNGEIRLFIVLTCVLGWIVYYLTAGKFIYGIMKKSVLKIGKRRRGKDRESSAEKL